jgi:hypothetical protein
MARITLGRQVVDTTQVSALKIMRVGAMKYSLIAGILAIIGLALTLTRVRSILIETVGMLGYGGIIGVIFVAALGLAWLAMSRPIVLDVQYSGGRGTTIECLSLSNAEEIKADLTRRISEERKRAG